MKTDNEQPLDFTDKLKALIAVKNTEGPLAVNRKIDEFVLFLQKEHGLAPRISELVGQQLLQASWVGRQGFQVVLNSGDRGLTYAVADEFKEGALECEWAVYSPVGTGHPITVHVRRRA